MNYRVLVIGCGNIGAQYDLDSDEITTHVKAWYLNDRTSLTIFDINTGLAQKIARVYECDILYELTSEALETFDILSICTPTSTHYEFMIKALNAKIKTIICEKPISNNISEIPWLIEAYNNGESKILVNYIRRFQPAFIALNKYIKSDLFREELTNVSIRYQRGFVNNCSHALDLLEFLFDSEISLKKIQLHNVTTDHFNDDPTLSLQAFWDKTNVSIQGLSNVFFSNFEIDLYFQMHKVLIRNAGNQIDVYSVKDQLNIMQPLVLQENLSQQQCIKNYMTSVTDYAVKITDNNTLEDNFLGSISLNRKVLNYKN